MKKLIAVLLSVLLIIGLCGCGSRSKVQGVWKNETLNVEFVFAKDGTYSYTIWGLSLLNGSYEIDDDTIILDNNWLEGIKTSCDYSVKGDVMNLTFDGTVIELTKTDKAPDTAVSAE